MAKATRKTASAPAPALTLAPAPAPVPAFVPAPARTPEGTIRVLKEIALGDGPSADFAMSLMVALKGGKASPKQVEAAERLADRHLNPLPALNFAGIVHAFTRLPSAKRFPKIRAVIGGVEVVVSYTSPASTKAKPENCGTCTVSSGEYGSPESKYYGRIMANGEFRHGGNFTSEVGDWLASLSNGKSPIVWGY